MSMNRTLLRLAAVYAINNFMKAPWPTIAGPNIFDSKIEPVEDMATDRAFPACVIYTDYDKDHWAFADKIHADRMSTLTIELLIVQAEKPAADSEASPVYTLGLPETDSEIEQDLDIFETQIFRALTKPEHEASNLFMTLANAYTNVISRRGATIEGGQRLAARQITIEMKTARDNINGLVSPEANAFLTKLAKVPDYAERADAIREQITAPAKLGLNDQLAAGIGLSKGLADRLGRPTGPQVKLPANLTYELRLLEAP